MPYSLSEKGQTKRPDKKDYPLIPDYLDAFEQWRKSHLDYQILGETGQVNLDNTEEAE